MAETNINIYLKTIDDSNETNPQDPGTTPEADNPIENKGEQGKSVKASTLVAVAYIGKQALSFAQSSVGFATRDNLKQQQTNEFNKLAMFTAVAIKNPILGTAMFFTDMIKSDVEYNRNVARESLAVNINRERAGNMNRSR